MVDRFREDLASPEGEVLTEEIVAEPDVLVTLFVLGPGAVLDTHEHPEAAAVFHILDGELMVTHDDEETRVSAPGVVFHDRDVIHGARNDTEDAVSLTASCCPPT